MSSFFRKLFSEENKYERQVDYCFKSHEQLVNEIISLKKSCKEEQDLSKEETKKYKDLEVVARRHRLENMRLKHRIQINEKRIAVLEKSVKHLQDLLDKARKRAYKIRKRFN